MIDDMASLKQAMEQMDADDVVVAHAGRDRAAQILSNDRLNFAKLAELIEERRLLLRPRIVASIKRMDQPDGLGDAAFRDTGASLRMEGQSFGQIAEAIELGGEISPRYAGPVRDAVRPMIFETAPPPGDSSREGSSFPLRGLVLLLMLGLLAVVSVYALREFAAGNWHLPGYRAGLRSIHQRADTAPTTSPAPVQPVSPPPAPATPPATTAPSASEVAPPSSAPTAQTNSPAANPPATNPPAANPPAATPPASTPPRYAPSNSATNDRRRTPPRAYNDFMPDQIRRKSRLAGPCMGGVGGCYWGGGQY